MKADGDGDEIDQAKGQRGGASHWKLMSLPREDDLFDSARELSCRCSLTTKRTERHDEISKVLLCAESPVSTAMFEGSFREAQEQAVDLELMEGVISKRSLGALFQWLYLRIVKFNIKDLREHISATIELARLADKYRITGIESQTAEYIQEIILANPDLENEADPEDKLGYNQTFLLRSEHIISGTLLYCGHPLSDELAYIATKSTMSNKTLKQMYPFDFDGNGMIKATRTPEYSAPLIRAHGLPLVAVARDTVALTGRQDASLGAALQDKNDKNRSVKYDKRWNRVRQQLQQESTDPVTASLPYIMEDGFLYSVQDDGSHWLCIPRSLAKDIFELVHDNQGHLGFDRCRRKMDGIVIYRVRRITNRDTIALTGRQHASLGAALQDKNDKNIKAARSAFAIGTLVAPRSFVNMPRTIDRQLFTHTGTYLDAQKTEAALARANFPKEFKPACNARDTMSSLHNALAVLMGDPLAVTSEEAMEISEPSIEHFATSTLPLFHGPLVKIHIQPSNREYTVPKNLLCGESPVFLAMFEGSFRESQEQTATLQEMEGVISVQSIEALLQWLYLRTIKFDLENSGEQLSAVIELARVADKYEITGIENQTAKYIKDTIFAINILSSTTAQ
ncbi:hypothetical protein N7501_000383 [Penicillium viridicatum]|nr:hypothetical protein N7501_000383 [Penicillium viridicatum]